MFFGTPAWAVPSLEALLDSDFDVVAVATAPDRPAGRRMEVRVPPVKVVAQAEGVEVLQPAKARAPEFLDRIRSIAPEIAVVVAYGSILSQELLDAVPFGFVNVHFSLLPAYRGAAPVQRAVMDGLDVSGVTIMILTAGMDEGPLVASEDVAIDSDDTAGTLGERMAAVGGRLLVATLPGYASGDLTPVEQDHGAATYAPKMSPDDAGIEWTTTAPEIRDFVRALNPAPGAWTTFRGRRVKVHRVEVVPGEGLAPGELAADADLRAGTGAGAVTLVEVQAAGKRRMSGGDLARGLRLIPGERLS